MWGLGTASGIPLRTPGGGLWLLRGSGKHQTSQVVQPARGCKFLFGNSSLWELGTHFHTHSGHTSSRNDVGPELISLVLRKTQGRDQVTFTQNSTRLCTIAV
jgi:hypothetical protein